MGLKADGA